MGVRLAKAILVQTMWLARSPKKRCERKMLKVLAFKATLLREMVLAPLLGYGPKAIQESTAPNRVTISTSYVIPII